MSSLKHKFFLAFLAFVFVAVLISFISIWSYQRYQKLNELIVLADSIQIQQLQMLNTEQDFFYYETINPIFFQTGVSSYLNQHQTLENTLKQQLENFPKEIPTLWGTNRDSSLRYQLRLSLQELEQYSNTFQEIIKLTQQRGFKDYGLEGKMRRTIHELEKDSPISNEKILMLRRHEKDYIIRKDTLYAQKLNTLVAELLEATQNMSLAPADKERLMEMLAAYRDDFMRIVQLEEKIGVGKHTGLRQELKKNSEKLQRNLNDMGNKVKEQIATSQEQLYYFYLYLVAFILIVTTFASSLLAKAIIKPLVELNQSVSKKIRGLFGLSYLPQNPENSTQNEILVLQRDFNFLIEEVKQQLNLVKQNATELEAQNEELNTINAQLAESENNLRKLNDVKDKFFSIISHDLRSPLHSLTGFLDILKNHADSFTAEETKNFAETMDEAVARILDLLENLLNWSLSQTGDIDYKPQIVDVNDAFERNAALYFKNAQKKEITLKIKKEQEPLLVWVDRNMLDFILRNLISNAVKFTNAGGKIILRMYDRETYAEIKVSDTGVGIKAEVIEKIFQIEERVSEPGTKQEKGTGFGLMLCKEFVEKNGGTIRIESEFGRGTTIAFTLKKVGQPAPKLIKF